MSRNRGDQLNQQQVKFASVYVGTGDARYAAAAAGYADTDSSSRRNIANVQVQAEIARQQTQRLFSEALPAAVGCLVEIITNSKAPAGARVQASKVVMDRTLGVEGASTTKEAHEMTAEELAKAIDELERVASSRAKTIEAKPAQDEDIFG